MKVARSGMLDWHREVNGKWGSSSKYEEGVIKKRMIEGGIEEYANVAWSVEQIRRRVTGQTCSLKASQQQIEREARVKEDESVEAKREGPKYESAIASGGRLVDAARTIRSEASMM